MRTLFFPFSIWLVACEAPADPSPSANHKPSWTSTVYATSTPSTTSETSSVTSEPAVIPLDCDTHAGTVAGEPFDNLVDAVAASTPGATLFVCPGLHLGSLEVAHDLVLEGLGAPEDVIIQPAQTSRPGIAVVGSGVLEARHITVQRGSRGISAPEATVLLDDVHLLDNTAPFGEDGGGVLMNTGRLDNVVITDNQAERGAGVFANSIEHVGGYIEGNVARDSGGGVYVHEAGLLWSLAAGVVSNRATEGNGGGVFTNAPVTAFESDFSDNRAVYGGCVHLGDSGSLTGGVYVQCRAERGAAVASSPDRTDPVEVSDVVVLSGSSDHGGVVDVEAPSGSLLSNLQVTNSEGRSMVHIQSCDEDLAVDALLLADAWIDVGMISLDARCQGVTVGTGSIVVAGSFRGDIPFSAPSASLLFADGPAAFTMVGVETSGGTTWIDGAEGQVTGPLFFGVCDGTGCRETP